MKWKRSKNKIQAKEPFITRWTSVSSRSYSPSVEKRKLQRTCWCRSTSLLGCSFGILERWSAWVGRKCCSWQQEVSYHSPSPSTCHPQRWGVEQIVGRSYYRSRRCVAKHPIPLFAKEDSKESLILSKTTGPFKGHPNYFEYYSLLFLEGYNYFTRI